ncbi:MAG TPA: ornithine cyclodeaminase family protein [Thermoplasmata archaeon]|jgi:ornithine cyclodeaminase/alanine dehydrogenase|nr:ornithine cyclodeaminase family protein [Thermoplasmata archaeon]
MSVLYLREEEVEGLLPMPDALAAVERAFLALGTGEAVNEPRRRVPLPHALLSVMPAGWASRGYLGFKYYTLGTQGIRFWVHLLDAETGGLLAILEADRLGQRRTGAASGIAAKSLSRGDASTVGILGTGWQAESQLEALCLVRPIRHIRCYGRTASRRLEFAKTMTSRLGVDVKATDSPRSAVERADIVVAATSSDNPVIQGVWLAPGCHVNAVGANRIAARELDDDVIRRCALITVDSIEQAELEAGDLVRPIQAQILGWDHVHELSEVVAGKIRGRSADDDITLFKSLGIGIEDIAAGALVYERARERKIGQALPM